LFDWLRGLFSALMVAVTPLNLAILSFIEAIFFPVPPDTLLIPLALSDREQALLWAAVATIASVTGAAVGYVVGLKGGRPLLLRFASAETTKKVEKMFRRYDVWAIGIAGFTPIPYKVFAIAAGVFALNFRRFLLASIFSRGARFSIEALLIMLYGQLVVGFLDRHFEVLTLGITAAVLLLLAAWAAMKRRQRREI